MSEHSTIGWTDATWPIVAGCDYVSPGCSNCWAVRDSWRLAHSPHKHIREAFEGVVRKTEDGKLVWTGLVRPLPFRLDWPQKWRAPRKIFVCSQADLFNPKVPDEFIADAFAVMADCPRHTFQVLTKHAARMRQLLAHDLPYEGPEWPLPNVWIGVTVEDRKRAAERIPELQRTPAAKRWISAEPMLESLGEIDLEGIDWAVGGGESAQTRETTRVCEIAWLREFRDRCKAAGVAYMNKQLGSRPILLRGKLDECDLVPTLPAGKTLRYKWHEPEHWPEDLRVQEFPA